MTTPSFSEHLVLASMILTLSQLSSTPDSSFFPSFAILFSLLSSFSWSFFCLLPDYLPPHPSQFQFKSMIPTSCLQHRPLSDLQRGLMVKRQVELTSLLKYLKDTSNSNGLKPDMWHHKFPLSTLALL